MWIDVLLGVLIALCALIVALIGFSVTRFGVSDYQLRRTLRLNGVFLLVFACLSGLAAFDIIHIHSKDLVIFPLVICMLLYVGNLIGVRFNRDGNGDRN